MNSGSMSSVHTIIEKMVNILVTLPTSVCVGLKGVACTAMLVAVVTKTLALNKGEKHVHFFMLDIQISKRVRAIFVIQQKYIVIA